MHARLDFVGQNRWPNAQPCMQSRLDIDERYAVSISQGVTCICMHVHSLI